MARRNNFGNVDSRTNGGDRIRRVCCGRLSVFDSGRRGSELEYRLFNKMEQLEEIMNATHVLDLLFGGALIGYFLGGVYVFPFIIAYDIGRRQKKEYEEQL